MAVNTKVDILIASKDYPFTMLPVVKILTDTFQQSTFIQSTQAKLTTKSDTIVFINIYGIWQLPLSLGKNIAPQSLTFV